MQIVAPLEFSGIEMYAMNKTMRKHDSKHSGKHTTLNEGLWLTGRHAVQAALQAGRRDVYEVFLAKGEPTLEPYLHHTRVKMVSKGDLDAQFPHAVHQGIAARVGALPVATLQDVWDSKLLIALDQVSDPHNLGAILRSADAFGCGGVLVPTARSAPLNDVVAKAASGALETVPVVEVNLAQALDKLKDKGFWSVGLTGYTDKTLAEVGKFDKTILVLGSEGEGLRDLVAKKCDFLAKLPMVGSVESLNVSVAAGISLYEINRSI